MAESENSNGEETNDKFDLPSTSSDYPFTANYKKKIAKRNIKDVLKTEPLLLKAKKMDPSIDVEQYTKDMLDARARNTISNGNAAPKKRLHQPKRRKRSKHNIDDANIYLHRAESAINDASYEQALIFLNKFDALHTSERAVALRRQLEKKSYFDENLGNARRLLKLAELLFPTKRAKNEDDIDGFDLDDCIENDCIRNSVPFPVEEERTIKFIVNNEVRRLINCGLDNMKKQKYHYAEIAFQRAQYLQPSNTYTEKLISDVQTEKQCKGEGKKIFSSPEAIGNMTVKEYEKLKKEMNESNLIPAANEYIRWAHKAFGGHDFECVETLLRLAEVFEFTEETRELFVMTARIKNGLSASSDTSDSEDDVIDFCMTREIKYHHQRRAEKAFIKGRMSEAWNLINKLKDKPTPYVTELKQKIYMLSPWNNFWIKILESS